MDFASSTREEDNIKEWTEMDFASSTLGQLKTGQDGKGLLRIHLWCPDDLPRLWDRKECPGGIGIDERVVIENISCAKSSHCQNASHKLNTINKDV